MRLPSSMVAVKSLPTRISASPQQSMVAQRQPFHQRCPTYASACSGTVRYSSTCACIGITATTIYAPTPVTTYTSTITTTVPSVSVQVTVPVTSTAEIATSTISTYGVETKAADPATFSCVKVSVRLSPLPL
jgi:hypothetical protein